MNTYSKGRRTGLVIALTTVFPMAGAEADEVEALISPNVAEATLKLPYLDKVNPSFRQYNGVNQTGVSGNVDVHLVARSEAGEWLKLEGREVGLTTQEFAFAYEKQGSWAVGLEYNQIPRYAPYLVKTAVAGIGTNTLKQPSYPGSTFDGKGVFKKEPALSELTLKTERDISTLTASIYLAEALKIGFSFKNEDKSGTRLDGVRGIAPSAPLNQKNIYNGFLFSPEPIAQNHKQIEGTIEYAGREYQVTAGYYGSFLTTRFNSMYIAPGTNTALVSPDLSPIALPADNSAQQIFVNGAYNFSADTRGTLKLVQSEGEQNERFLSGQAALPSTGNSLHGKVQTSEAYASLSSRVTKDFKILATWRYERKEDKTPLRLTALTASPVTYYYNNPESHTAHWGKLEGDYHLGGGYGLTFGVDQTEKRSQEWDRLQTKELTSRVALRKAMGETVNGTWSLAHSERTGAAWDVAAVANQIYPVYLADRQRDKARGLLDWSVSEELSLQLAYEAYVDRYGRNTYGLDRGAGQIISLDASYTIGDIWKLNAWYSNQTGDSKQYMQGGACTTADCTGKTARNAPYLQWDALLKANSEQLGFAVTGKIQSLEIGGQYLYARDRNQQDVSRVAGSRTCTTLAGTTCTAYGTVVGSMGVLPDTLYAQHTLKLFAEHTLRKGTRLRVDYIYDRRKIDDYTWSNWVYADGTRVYVKPEQTTQIVGLSLTQAF